MNYGLERLRTLPLKNSFTMRSLNCLLVRAALAHAPFETIHPFLDGKGHVGRLLITFILCSEGIVTEPPLYLSLYFKANRATETAKSIVAFRTVRFLTRPKSKRRATYRCPLRRAHWRCWKKQGIIEEITGQDRHKIFAHRAYLRILKPRNRAAEILRQVEDSFFTVSSMLRYEVASQERNIARSILNQKRSKDRPSAVSRTLTCFEKGSMSVRSGPHASGLPSGLQV